MPHIPAQMQLTDVNDNGFYMILYPDDYDKHGVGVDGNVALLLDKENAKEVRRLADEIINKIDERAGADD